MALVTKVFGYLNTVKGVIGRGEDREAQLIGLVLLLGRKVPNDCPSQQVVRARTLLVRAAVDGANWPFIDRLPRHTQKPNVHVPKGNEGVKVLEVQEVNIPARCRTDRRQRPPIFYVKLHGIRRNSIHIL